MIRTLIGAVALAATVASPAWAHRGHDAMSVVSVDAQCAVTVSHRFEAHDIEPALVDIAPEAQPSLDDPDAVAALEAYVQRRFALSIDGKPIELSPGAQAIGASQVRLDLVGQCEGEPKTMTIASAILTDVYPSQVNQVFVHAGNVAQTLQFTGSEPQTIGLQQGAGARWRGGASVIGFRPASQDTSGLPFSHLVNREGFAPLLSNLCS